MNWSGVDVAQAWWSEWPPVFEWTGVIIAKGCDNHWLNDTNIHCVWSFTSLHLQETTMDGSTRLKSVVQTNGVLLFLKSKLSIKYPSITLKRICNWGDVCVLVVYLPKFCSSSCGQNEIINHWIHQREGTGRESAVTSSKGIEVRMRGKRCERLKVTKCTHVHIILPNKIIKCRG